MVKSRSLIPSPPSQGITLYTGFPQWVHMSWGSHWLLDPPTQLTHLMFKSSVWKDSDFQLKAQAPDNGFSEKWAQFYGSEVKPISDIQLKCVKQKGEALTLTQKLKRWCYFHSRNDWVERLLQHLGNKSQIAYKHFSSIHTNKLLKWTPFKDK